MKDVDRVLSTVKAAGGRPLIVGGYVRDNLLGLGSKDIDIEVFGLHPHELAEALCKVGAVEDVGASFGVFKIRSGVTDIDVSLPRTDSKTGAGHRGFEVIPDINLGLAEASARRDFTINAMMFDPATGTIIDLHGGQSDMRARILRHTSPAFSDDPLRVLRGVQFAARFGFNIHPDTAELCRGLRSTYREISTERIWGEFEKIGTRGHHMFKATQALHDTGWMEFFPELRCANEFKADLTAERADEDGIKGEDRFVLVFAALLCNLTETEIREFLTRVGCPRHIIARIVPLVREHWAFIEVPTAARARQLARRLVPSNITELHVIYPSSLWRDGAVWLGVDLGPEKPILTGDHLIAAGFKPGPAFKDILRAALEAQDAGDFRSEAGAIQWMEENAS